MKTINITQKAIKKAGQSICKFRVSAIGLNHKGEYIGSATNRPRFSRYKGGVHAEMRLMSRYKNHLKSIIICRIGNTGDLLPIEPCSICYQKAQELGIKIISLNC